MLNKPKFMVPSTNVQECTVDMKNDSVYFSCIVDGNEAVYAWRIKIYRLFDNVLVYDTGKVMYEEGIYKSPSLPFFPVNEKNQNVIFKVDLKQYPTIDVPIIDINNNTIKPTPVLENSQEPYSAFYWTIEFWNNKDNSSEGSLDASTTKSCEEVFYANTTPSIQLMYKEHNEVEFVQFSDNGYDIPKLAANSYTFKAVYTQEEGVPLKRYGWKLTDTDTGHILLDTITQNQIYGTAENILCSYDGFLNNCNYSIEVYIETQNNAMITSTPFSFFVSYPTTFLTNDFSTEVLVHEAAVRNSWDDAKVIEGHSSYDTSRYYIPEYPIVGKGTSSIIIPDNEQIVYDYGATSNLDIDENSYVVLSFQLFDDRDTNLFHAEGFDSYGNAVIRKLSFNGGQFEYIISDGNGGFITEYHTPSIGYSPNQYVWYVVIMAPCFRHANMLTVVESRAEGSLYPNANTYPSVSNYPSFGNWISKENKEDLL